MMSTKSHRTEPSESFTDFGIEGLPPLSNRDMVCMVLPQLDYDAQLMAVSQLLRRNRETEDAISEEAEILARRSVVPKLEHGR